MARGTFVRFLVLVAATCSGVGCGAGDEGAGTGTGTDLEWVAAAYNRTELIDGASGVPTRDWTEAWKREGKTPRFRCGISPDTDRRVLVTIINDLDGAWQQLEVDRESGGDWTTLETGFSFGDNWPADARDVFFEEPCQIDADGFMVGG